MLLPIIRAPRQASGIDEPESAPIFQFRDNYILTSRSSVASRNQAEPPTHKTFRA
jgi:hypothetical protein